MQDIFSLLQKTINQFKTSFSSEFKDKEITHEQFVLLALLKKDGSQYQQELAVKLNKDKPNITRMIDILEQKGFLVRNSFKKDRRKHKICLTYKGSKLIGNLEPIINRQKLKIVNSLTFQEKETLIKLIEKISKGAFIFFLIININFMYSPITFGQTIDLASSKTQVQDTKDFYSQIDKLPQLEAKDLNIPESKLKGEIELILDEKQVPITFEKALDIAMHNNFDIQIITTQKEQRRWLYYNTGSYFVPDVFYNYSISRISGDFVVGNVIPLSISETPIQSNLYVSYDIFTGLRRYFDLQAAKNRLESKKSELNFTVSKVLFDTTENYYLLLRNKLNIRIQRVNLQQFEEQLKINKARFESGIGTKFDLLRAEAQVALAKQGLIEAYNRLRLSQAQLANTIGLNVFTPLFPEEEDIKAKTLVPQEISNLNSLNLIALDTRQDLKRAKFDIDVAHAEKKSAYSVYLPQVNVTGQLADQGTARLGVGRNYAITLLAQYNGFYGLGTRGATEIKARDARLQEYKLVYTNEARNIQNNLLDAYYNNITARDLILTSNREVKSAVESLRLALLRLNAGIGIYIDVLQSQVSATSAKTNLLNAIIGYNISQARLLYETGLISPENLLKDYGGAPQAESQKILPQEIPDNKEKTNEKQQKTKTGSNSDG